MNHFALVLAVSTLLDIFAALVSLVVVSGCSRQAGEPLRLTLPVVLLAAGPMALFALVKLAIMFRWGLNCFGVCHVLYLDVAVVLPVLGVLVLAVARLGAGRLGQVRVSWSVMAAACLALVPAPVAAYATFVAPYRLAIEETRVEVPRMQDTPGELTIAVLADLQFDRVTQYEEDAIQAAVTLKPDLIVIAGDLFQGTETGFRAELASIRALLGRLHAPGGVFLIPGNCDRREHLREAVVGTGVVLLVNDLMRVEVRGSSVLVGGVEYAYYSPAAERTIGRLGTEGEARDIRLLLSHTPDVVLRMPQPSGIDLVVAGHSHGGQICVPGWGPPITACRVPRAVAAGGLSVVDGTTLYVSRGVGHEQGQAPRLRFFCSPELSLLTLAPP